MWKVLETGDEFICSLRTQTENQGYHSRRICNFGPDCIFGTGTIIDINNDIFDLKPKEKREVIGF
ncbi:MAG: hypothetical protein R2769_04205 [Saprospiraceae bacterium]